VVGLAVVVIGAVLLAAYVNSLKPMVNDASVARDEVAVSDVEAVEAVDCDEARNHGQYVSSVARSTPSGPGKGAVVAAAAASDCGKKVKPGPRR
jgi:hypothetical protein